MASSLYLAAAALLTALGLLGAASIGLPFLLLGLTLFGAYPIRDRRDILLPILFGELAFFVTAALVAPWGCRASATFGNDPGTTTCDNPLGIVYSGEGLDDPPLWPAVLAGVVVGLAVAFFVRRMTLREGASPS